MHLTKVKVRYAETDQMGVVHHSNYPIYCELARTEWLESFGISYREMEEGGLMLPVSNLSFDYKKTAKYNDILYIETTLGFIKGARINILYKIMNSHKEIITLGETTLVFVDMKSGRPIRCPDDIMEALT